ncbi:protein kinase [Trypanosoma rangeli]|uniref:Protein kinase n=1 Tax=Trypanosoma rangeli TaxID=5698 RepID=A0A3R7K681_TRYRA|nr:protein kinase [Trypanosoma rangeli]RNF00627.1 protein kinase [Trypanosoma rangeli]|eukprot:RNF00627.1 protein kinase [Trypanosoma rangeli]
MTVPSPMRVPVTPVVESVDVRDMYDADNATLVGKGGFSDVVSVLHRPTNTKRALKVMRKEMLRGRVAEMVLHEREILRRISHPNIVKLHEVITTPHHVYFALDLMDCDLFALIFSNKFIPEGGARCIMYQLLCGIAFLHSQSIVHRDIKPENILVNISKKQGNCESALSRKKPGIIMKGDWEKLLNIEVKLADFGLAKLVKKWDVQSTPCGTSFYIAPEVIRGIEAQGTKPLCTTQELVKSVDVWSAGIVLFIMLSGRPPFHGQVTSSEDRRQLLRRIDRWVLFRTKQCWDGISEEAKDLIVRMLEQDSSKRLTAMQALQHPFFANHGFRPPSLGAPKVSPELRQQPEEKPQAPQQPQPQQREEVVNAQQPTAVDNEVHKEMNTTHVEKGWGGTDVPSHVVVNKFKGFLRMFRPKSHVKRAGGKVPLTEGKQQSPPSEDEDEEPAEEHVRSMHAEIDALQKDIIETGDTEGDNTCYTPQLPLMTAPRTKRPAVMNAKAKVGPAALRRQAQ